MNNRFVFNVAAGRPPRGGVDRNGLSMTGLTGEQSRPPRGGVDRNFLESAELPDDDVAPLSGAWIET